MPPGPVLGMGDVKATEQTLVGKRLNRPDADAYDETCLDELTDPDEPIRLNQTV
jgi:hypothetical protein